MLHPNPVKVSMQGDRTVVVSRVFDALRRLVFDAHIKPELIRRWLTGPPGWVMTVCDFEAKVGGAYRYVWKKDETEMGMGGVILEVVPLVRVAATERFDESWYPGDATCTTELDEVGGRTTLTISIQYSSADARDTVLQSGMVEGLSYSYDQLAKLLAELTADESPQ